MTPGKCSEAEVLRNSLEAGWLYVTDRGYQDYGFFRAIIDDGSSFISRVKDNIAFQLQEERSLSHADRDAYWFQALEIDRLLLFARATEILWNYCCFWGILGIDSDLEALCGIIEYHSASLSKRP